MTKTPEARRDERGATTVEFAFVAVLLFTLLLGAMDFGRMLFIWNAAAEATRWGARVAVVCDKLTPDQVRDKMRRILPQLEDENILIQWYNPEAVADNACNNSNCKSVSVSLQNFQVQAISPFMGFVMPLVPPFTASMPRESMEATSSDGYLNPVCS